MGQLANAALSAWGVAALVFVAVAIGAAVALRGQTRKFAAALAGIVAVMLAGVAIMLAPQSEEDLAPERALAGMETNQANIPRADRDVAAALINQALREGNSGNTDGARKTYDRAKQLYRNAKDTLGEATVVLGEARLEHMVGQSARARTSYNEALKLFLQGGSAIGQARTYASMGDLEKDTFQWTKASEYYSLARQSWGRAPEPKSDPHVLLGIEDVPLMREGEAKARAQLLQARKIYDQLGDKSGLGDMQAIEARLEMNLGRIDLARAKLGEARGLYAVGGNQPMQGDAGLAMAQIDISRGYNRQARQTIDQTLADFAGNATGIARTRIAEGDLERMQGRLQKAKEAYAGAAGTLEGAGHRAAAEALRKLGEVEGTLGDAAAAKVSLNKAIATASRAGVTDEEARGQLAAAVQARAVGDPDTADRHATTAAALFDRQNNKPARARAALVRAIDQAGYNDATTRFDAAQMPFGLVMAYLGLGDTWRGRGNTAEAATAYRQAERTWAGIESKVAEANKVLGLPAVEALLIVPTADPTDLAAAIDEHVQAGEPDPALVKANLDDFPDHNIEARKLVAQVEARLTAALDFAR